MVPLDNVSTKGYHFSYLDPRRFATHHSGAPEVSADALHYGQIHYIRVYEKSNFKSLIIGNLYDFLRSTQNLKK